MSGRTGLRKVVKTVKGKKGTVRRSYWVKSAQTRPPGQRTLRQSQPSKEGFLQRHAGKIAAGAALLGAAALHRHKLTGAVRSAQSSLGKTRGGAVQRAQKAFSAAKRGYESQRGKDRIDALTKRLGPTAKAARRGVGSLAGHLVSNAGAALANHAGSAAGSYAGSALGGMFGGPLGAHVGGIVGSHVGEWLSERHVNGRLQAAGARIEKRSRR